jgi:hypothetical protein
MTKNQNVTLQLKKKLKEGSKRDAGEKVNIAIATLKI